MQSSDPVTKDRSATTLSLLSASHTKKIKKRKQDRYALCLSASHHAAKLQQGGLIDCYKHLIKKMSSSLYDITKGICICNVFQHTFEEERTRSNLWRSPTCRRQAELEEIVHFAVWLRYVSLDATCSYNCNPLAVEIIHLCDGVCILCMRRYICAKLMWSTPSAGLVAQAGQQRAAHSLFERPGICLGGQIVFT